MYVNKTLKEYLDDLAAKKPAPGGGSSAALCAVMGTSLMSMVINYTIGKSAYKESEDLLSGIFRKVQKGDAELRALIDEDISAYKKLLAGMKDASLDDEKKDQLYKDAAEPPLMVCEISARCIKLCGELASNGNKNLITDTAAAVVFLDAAFFSARFNVYANLKYIKDTGYIAKVHGVLAPLEEEMAKLKEEVLEMCEDVISS